MESGHSYFLEHFSKEPAAMDGLETRAFADGLPLSPDQAMFVYDYVDCRLEYARGFGMLGFDDSTITIADIFNTAIPDQREACGEISGKALSVAKSNALNPVRNGIVLNYAGQSTTGDLVHLMLESAVFRTDLQGNMISAFTTISKLHHLPVPKLVRWNVFGDMSEILENAVDEELIHPCRISRRETDVLTRLADGLTSAKIATALSISPRTVEQHVQNMRQRFECTTIGQLVAFAKDMDLF